MSIKELTQRPSDSQIRRSSASRTSLKGFLASIYFEDEKKGFFDGHS